jgi:hypothetical protein
MRRGIPSASPGRFDAPAGLTAATRGSTGRSRLSPRRRRGLVEFSAHIDQNSTNPLAKAGVGRIFEGAPQPARPPVIAAVNRPRA